MHETWTQTLARRVGARVCTVTCALALAGCAVGPDFRKPAPPDTDRYTAQPSVATVATPDIAGGNAQRFDTGADIAGDWWTLFHSKQLNALIEAALADNPDLKAAQAALTAAHEAVLAQRGAYLPQVDAEFNATRYKQPASLAPVPSNNALLYNLFTPQVSVSYTPDVFGLNRRSVESLQAQAQSTRFQMIAAWNTLTSNVAVAAITDASLKAQIDATREQIRIETQSVELMRYRYRKGDASQLDVSAQETQLAQTQGSLPSLLQQRDQQRHLLAVLTGKLPAQASIADFDLADLQLPADLPLSLPSKLVEQRPDVRQAQANWHAASAQVGVAIAQRFPNITLSGDAGSSALAIGQVFKTGTGFWTLGADVLAPIFQGGQLLHQQRAAEAAYTQAAEQYRSTVLTAFQNVADTLTALQHDAETLQAAAIAERAAHTTLDLSRRQLRDGYIDQLALLSAEQAYSQARIALVQAQASRYADTAALFQALGGGWWHRAELAETHDDRK
ncbi:MAG: efflux transporter outer membrane subunit [Mizugakiibacter sp.]|uniref:efflux transporter outer membrane subunit n=1 Tax=Mizugakiibacter sp. TaxID=1972610 RepID=UPI0031C6FB9E|nr:efflux transporter outer membrane subunit [Xanthomonadaceae bacterium]